MSHNRFFFIFEFLEFEKFHELMEFNVPWQTEEL